MDLTTEFKNSHFFHQLDDLFASRDYLFMPELKQFRRTNTGGFQNVIITPSFYKDAVIFEVSFGTRFNLVEETVQCFTPAKPAFPGHSNTILTSYGKYLNQPYFRYRAESPLEFGEVALSLRSFFEKDGFAFLEDMCDITKAERAINGLPHQKSRYASNQDLRIFRGLVLASVANRDELEKLTDIYLDQLLQRNADGQLLKDFTSITEFLRNFGLN